MKVCLHKATGRIIEAQSDDDKKGLETLLGNAKGAGYKKCDVVVKLMPDTEFNALLAAQVEAEKDYGHKRREAYPSVAEQLDMLWHAIDAGTSVDKNSDFYTSIAAVKKRFPKP